MRNVHLYLIVFLSSVFLLQLFIQAPATHAISAEQRRLFHSGVNYYDIDVAQTSCTFLGSGGPGNTSIGGDFSLGSDNDLRRLNLMSVLMSDYGLTAEQAAGVVGNFMHESGGIHLPPNYNEVLGIDGDGEGPPRQVIPRTNTGGYGWAQWTGGRKVNFIEFSIENGYMDNWEDEATDAANYAFLKHELNTGYMVTLEELARQTTIEGATISFESTYEKAGNKMMDARIGYAEQVFGEFQGSDISRGLIPGSCAGQGGAAIHGGVAFPLLVSQSDIHNRSIFSDGTTSLAGHPYTAYDILVDPGTPVVAFMSGTVTNISQDRCPGRLIGVYNEEANLIVSYLHLSFQNHVQLGDEVTVGEVIGEVGSTREGCVVPHLHIDVATGSSRPGCSRLNCPTANQRRFVDIGSELYETYQLLEE